MYDNRGKEVAAIAVIDYRLPHGNAAVVVIVFTGNEVKSVTSCLMMTMTQRQATATAT